MAALLLLLAFLLVAGAGGGGLGTAALGTDDATRSYYSSDSEVMAYWKRVLRNSPMPLALVEHLNSFDGLSLSLMDGDDGKTTLRCGPNMDGDDGKATLRWGPNMDGDDGKATLRWGPNMDGDDGKATLRWGTNMDGDDGKATLRWGPNMDGDDGKATLRWGTNMDGDDGKATLRWGPNMDGDDGKATLRWGTNMDGDDGKATLRWGPNMDGDDGKATLRWGTNMDGDDGKATLRWGPNMDGDDGKATLRWGTNMDGDVEKVIDQLGSDANGDDGKATLRWRPDDQNIREGHHQVHGTGHNHGQFDLENLLFLEAVLTPGTLMAPYIEPSVVFPAPFLPREIADSIPISTKNFTDILSMFAPMSLSIASKIWSTLDTCEHPHPLEGERQACATSIESMVELAASVLGTRDVRAFSSSYVPAEGFASPLSKYKVAAVRAITAPDEEATTMTCHGVTFPYAVFYCHAVNPTRVYDVTLQSVEEDGAATAATMPAGKKTMQALAVCHLDTSQFDPENPFFVARGLKPGDAAVCHFLSRDSVLWAPAASTQGHAAQ